MRQPLVDATGGLGEPLAFCGPIRRLGFGNPFRVQRHPNTFIRDFGCGRPELHLASRQTQPLLVIRNRKHPHRHDAGMLVEDPTSIR
jgi:hypothetical protein